MPTRDIVFTKYELRGKATNSFRAKYDLMKTRIAFERKRGKRVITFRRDSDMAQVVRFLPNTNLSGGTPSARKTGSTITPEGKL